MRMIMNETMSRDGLSEELTMSESFRDSMIRHLLDDVVRQLSREEQSLDATKKKISSVISLILEITDLLNVERR